jgi:hypothetical protein
MDVTRHAVERAVQRLGVTEESALELLAWLWRNGHTPCGREWAAYNVTPQPGMSYRAHGHRMVVANVEQGRIITVLTPQFVQVFKHPDLRTLRGMTVHDALKRYQQE